MKKKFSKSKSFTLIELLISVSIFVVVTVMVIAILSMTVSSRSKMQATDELRTEAGKIMAEIKEMVERGNNSFRYPPSGPGPPDRIFFGLATIKSDFTNNLVCNPSGDIGLESRQVDSQGNSIRIRLFQEASRLKMEKTINGTVYPADYITPVDLEITSFEVGGDIRGIILVSGSCTGSQKVNVALTIQGKTRGYVGEKPTITLQSTFTSHYPNPDLAGDSS